MIDELRYLDGIKGTVLSVTKFFLIMCLPLEVKMFQHVTMMASAAVNKFKP